jgi:hypothetical protein
MSLQSLLNDNVDYEAMGRSWLSFTHVFPLALPVCMVKHLFWWKDPNVFGCGGLYHFCVWGLLLCRCSHAFALRGLAYVITLFCLVSERMTWRKICRICTRDEGQDSGY